MWLSRGRIYWFIINYLGESLAKIHLLVYYIDIVRNVIHFVLYTVLGRRGEDSLTSNSIGICILGQVSNAEKVLPVILIGQLCKKSRIYFGILLSFHDLFTSQRGIHIPLVQSHFPVCLFANLENLSIGIFSP